MQTKSLIPSTWQVPADFRERLGRRVGRQRLMVAEGHLLLVLHAPPEPDEEERVGRLFWRDPAGEWKSSDHGTGRNCVSKHLASYEDAVDKLEHLEMQSKKGGASSPNVDDYFVLLESLLPLHRSATHQYQVLEEARKAIPEDRDLINFRDLSYDLDRQTQLLYSGTKNALEFDIARRAEQQARASRKMATAAHRLNLMASFFFPIATLSAIFGMNMVHGWEDEPGPIPFLVLIMGGLLCGVFLTLILQQPFADDHEKS